MPPASVRCGIGWQGITEPCSQRLQPAVTDTRSTMERDGVARCSASPPNSPGSRLSSKPPNPQVCKSSPAEGRYSYPPAVSRDCHVGPFGKKVRVHWKRGTGKCGTVPNHHHHHHFICSVKCKKYSWKNKRILNKANQAHTSAYGSLYMGLCVHTVRAIIYSENVGTHTKKH